ncbi:TPA 5-methyltetrahydrofolate-homocysteine methyltransferase [Sarcoptes scabiei]|nr:TPA 5-methyltetrahydrofolate-homocysteine methyltransferase [Sarcoptes scabiei]
MKLNRSAENVEDDRDCPSWIGSDPIDKCWKRLFEYRRKLSNELEDFLSKSTINEQFIKQIDQKISDAKQIHDDCLQNSSVKDQSMDSISSNDDENYLKLRMLSLKKSKLLLILFHTLYKSNQSFNSKMLVLQADQFKKLNLSDLIENLDTLRNDFIQIVEIFNSLLKIGIIKRSDLFEKFHEYLEKDVIEKLRDLVEKIFEYSLNLIEWPSIGIVGPVLPSSSKKTVQNVTSEEPLKLFRLLFRFFLELEHGRFLSRTSLRKNSILFETEIFKKLSPTVSAETLKPFDLMIETFRKRFYFYFIDSSSKLNKIENPEWYLCQIEQWITLNEKFLNTEIDPILDSYFETNSISSQRLLIVEFLKLIHNKLRQDLNIIEQDDQTFKIIINELIIFNKQITIIDSQIYQSDPRLNPLSILFENQMNFARFLKFLKQKFNGQIESIFESESSWCLIYGDETDIERAAPNSSNESESDKFMICEAAYKFLLFLHNIIEQYSYLPDFDYREKILVLIVDLIDDFRLRLSQILHSANNHWPFEQKFFSILNTFDYLLANVNDLNLNPDSFLASIVPSKIDHHETSLKNLVQTLQHMIEEIFELVSGAIISSFIDDLQKLNRIRWNRLKTFEIETIGQRTTGDDEINDDDDQNRNGSVKITAQSLQIFYNLSIKINHVKKFISKNLFNDFLYLIAEKIQNAMLQNFLIKKSFNQDGIKQLEIDLEHCLYPIFLPFVSDIKDIFPKIFDYLILLNLSNTTCQRLIASWNGDHLAKMQFKIELNKIGIYSLRLETVVAAITNQFKLDKN